MDSSNVMLGSRSRSNNRIIITIGLIYFYFLCPLLNVYANQFIFNGTEDVEEKTLVHPPSGPISGLFLLRNNANISCYLGVPYAEPPVGRYRFIRSSMVSPWKVPFRAVHQNRICIQTLLEHYNPKDFEIVRLFNEKDPSTLPYYETEMTEDCLQLSLFTKNVRKMNKTVLVWIHGGGFINGASMLPNYDYPTLASFDEDIIIVAINYRLNIFGFITSGTEALKGNLGLNDQVLALEWIKNNIEAFGGNPNNIVLWGQSAGSAAVGFHVMSTASAKLFKRVIMESGSPLLPITMTNDLYRQKAFIDYIKLTNCMKNQSEPGNLDEYSAWIVNNIKDILECLQAKTTEEIFKSYNSIVKQYPIAFLPMANDSDLFNFTTFWSGVKQEKFNLDKDILIGTNEDEGAQYVKIGPFQKYYHWDRIDPNFTKANIIATLKDYFKDNLFLEELTELTVKILGKNVKDVNNSTQMWTRYVQLVSDMVFGCPDFHFIKQFVKNRPTLSVYYYRFKPRVSKPVECAPWATGSCHTDELQFVMGIPLLYQQTFPNQTYPIDEIQMSKSIMNTWLQFAHYGHFNQTALNKKDNNNIYNWLPFNDQHVQYLSIDKEYAKMTDGFPAQNCQDLFKTLNDLLDDFFQSKNILDYIKH